MSAPSSLPASLYTIESAIVELYLLRDEAEHEGDTQAVAVIDEQIAEWAKSELRKVDGIASWIRECEARAELAENESKRLKDRAKEWQAKADRVREAALRAMQEHNVTKPLQGQHSTLRIQKNGGLQKLDVAVADVPEQYQIAIVRISMRLWRRIAKELSEVECREVSTRSIDVDQEAIRQALAMQIICPECRSEGEILDYVSECGRENFIKCPRCEGKGTIPNSIPGAKLKERSSRLVVE